MQLSTKTLLLGLIGAASLASQSVQAITISTIGSFNTPTATSSYFYKRIANQDDSLNPTKVVPSNTGTMSDSVAYFGWGIDVYDSLIQGEIIQSHFWFNGAGSVDGAPEVSALLGQAFSVGSFTYTNETTILSGGIVDINFNMDLTIDGLNLAPVQYGIEVNNTPNITGNNALDYDTATIISSPSDITFFLGDGLEYKLTVLGFTRDNGATFETWTNLAENAQTSANIYATITQVTAVPVPAAIWLMGSGLLALFGFARTQK